jgi:hypothetical protein
MVTGQMEECMLDLVSVAVYLASPKLGFAEDLAKSNENMPLARRCLLRHSVLLLLRRRGEAQHRAVVWPAYPFISPGPRNARRRLSPLPEAYPHLQHREILEQVVQRRLVSCRNARAQF